MAPHPNDSTGNTSVRDVTSGDQELKVTRRAADAASEVAQEATTAASDVASEVKQASADVAETIAQDTKQVAQSAMEQAGEVARIAAEQGRTLMTDARMQIKTQAEQQAEKLAGLVGEFAGQLRALSEARPEEAGKVGDIVQEMADRVDSIARKIHERGYDGALTELK
ncbi:MAG TPA: hypothetical protein VM600_01310, partial [Actinomycetota bacterium]|nr:hypothetical protein [Actinomycetota bacterium]